MESFPRVKLVYMKYRQSQNIDDDTKAKIRHKVEKTLLDKIVTEVCSKHNYPVARF